LGRVSTWYFVPSAFFGLFFGLDDVYALSSVRGLVFTICFGVGSLSFFLSLLNFLAYIAVLSPFPLY